MVHRAQTNALAVLGTGSDVGKTLVVAGLCRLLFRKGLRVAPFKAQNMALNSFATLDGGEIGRAQALQAQACGIEPTVDMNPILLKPESDSRSQVVVKGKVYEALDALAYFERKEMLLNIVRECYSRLAGEYECVVIEGAGSAAEINLRDRDIVNWPVVELAEASVLLVADIDRGGVFAQIIGTLDLLAPHERHHVRGVIVNKFRGDRRLFEDGVRILEARTGLPVLGVIPYLRDLRLDQEDSLDLTHSRSVQFKPDLTNVAVVLLPRMSNFTDFNALSAEKDVALRFAVSRDDLSGADVVILPGSKNTLEDLNYLVTAGFPSALQLHMERGGELVGICGGYQMLAERIHDPVESCRGTVGGLGLLPIEIAFAREKTLRRPSGTAFGGVPVQGYEIHHGSVCRAAADLEPLIRLAGGGTEGTVLHNIYGTHWHGALESDAFRRAFLAIVAAQAGRNGFVVAPDTEFAALRERTFDLLGDLVEEHLDTRALWQLIETGPPAGLRLLAPGAP